MPTGVGEDGEIGIWDAMVEADDEDGIRNAVRIELKSVVGAATKVANKPGESSEINYPRGGACFCKFADSKKDIGPPMCCRQGREKYTQRSGRGGVVVFFVQQD